MESPEGATLQQAVVETKRSHAAFRRMQPPSAAGPQPVNKFPLKTQNIDLNSEANPEAGSGKFFPPP
ncbi:MAG: hypothetical protein JWM04_122 [Verrucomicrobiales bacterium]|jgi:hypothetical protein|nr:hypothetical protein [Verrucomicrobiales bacterium]